MDKSLSQIIAEKILKKINHLPSLDDCQRERKYLYKWGGGCNLDVGVTIENILNEKILFAQGKDNQTKKYFKEKKYLNNKEIIKTIYVENKLINFIIKE